MLFFAMLGVFTTGRRHGGKMGSGVARFHGTVVASSLALVMAMSAAPRGACAENAEDCVKLGRQERSQTIRNVCSKPVYVIWCHEESAQSGSQATRCRAGKVRYYTQAMVLKPGQTHDNFFTMPLDATLRFGACLEGTANSTQVLDDKGSYLCGVTRRPGKDEEWSVLTSTAKGASSGEVCGKLLDQAKGGEVKARYVGACSCETVKEGVAYRCRVPAIVRKTEGASSPTGAGKRIIREMAPADGGGNDDFLDIKTPNAASGIRG